MPGTTTANASFVASSDVLTQVAAATTTLLVFLSTAMTDHVAKAEPSKETKTASNRINFFKMRFPETFCGILTLLHDVNESYLKEYHSIENLAPLLFDGSDYSLCHWTFGLQRCSHATQSQREPGYRLSLCGPRHN